MEILNIFLKTVFTLSGVLFLFLGYKFYNHQEALIKNGIVVEGTVVEWIKIRIKGKGSGFHYKPTVQFIAQENGQEIKFDDSGYYPKKTYEIGERVEVIYNPDNVLEAHINNPKKIRSSPLWVMAIAVGFILMGVFANFSKPCSCSSKNQMGDFLTFQKEYHSINLLGDLSNWNSGDFDAYVDYRNSVEFEDQWSAAVYEVNRYNKKRMFRGSIRTIKETVFKKAFDVTQNSEVADYVSDDFELIAKNVFHSKNNEFVNGMWQAYKSGKLPR